MEEGCGVHSNRAELCRSMDQRTGVDDAVQAEEAVQLSLSSSGAWLDELKNVIHLMTVEEQNSSTHGEVTKKERATTASMTVEAVNTLGEEMKREQTPTANAITTMGCVVRRVVTKVDVIQKEILSKVDVIEEEVGAAKKGWLRKQQLNWKKLKKPFRSKPRRFNRWNTIWQK